MVGGGESGLDLADGVLADNALRAITVDGVVHPERDGRG
jgi:hypothetical protein